jgi:cobalt-zinc-cadmium efflux system outer membrane protein
MNRVILVAAAACVGVSMPARGQTILTLEATITLAREQSASVVIARARIAEAEAGLLDVAARFRENPVVEANVGPRSTAAGSSTELDIGVSQQFESGGQRSARQAGVRASIDRQTVAVNDAARDAVFEAATTFLAGIAAGERLRIAEEADTVGRELLSATERRYRAGDIAAIDLNLSRIDAARSAAALQAARADLIRAVGTLRALLRLPGTEPIELEGSLAFPSPAPVEQLRAAIDQRPDFSVLLAEAREADAQVQLGRALGRPDLGLRFGYEREATDTILLGGLTVRLPAFQRGQGTLASGLARATRARLELEAGRQRALADLDTAYAAYQQHATLAATFSDDALASVQDNEDLARRSYDAGELGLLDYLLIRRQALETRTAVVDRRLDAARNRLNVDYVAGVLR